jgi:hypothetical protein
MGFDEVIMAGITLSQKDSKYVAGYPNKYLTGSDYATAAQIDNWLGILKGHVNAGRMSGVYSMSGSTSKILGTPC